MDFYRIESKKLWYRILEPFILQAKDRKLKMMAKYTKHRDSKRERQVEEIMTDRQTDITKTA